MTFLQQRIKAYPGHPGLCRVTPHTLEISPCVLPASQSPAAFNFNTSAYQNPALVFHSFTPRPRLLQGLASPSPLALNTAIQHRVNAISKHAVSAKGRDSQYDQKMYIETVEIACPIEVPGQVSEPCQGSVTTRKGEEGRESRAESILGDCRILLCHLEDKRG